MIALSVPMFIFNWRRGLTLFSVGWALQFIGHFVFEKNNPIVFSRKRHALTLVSALFFVCQEWLDTLKSVSYELYDSGNGHRLLELPLSDNDGGSD